MLRKLLVDQSSQRDGDGVSEVGDSELAGPRRAIEDRNERLEKHDSGENQQTANELAAINRDFAPEREDED